MATGNNDYLAFATNGGAPVLSQAAYASSVPGNGRGPGIVPKESYNKSIRQGTAMAAAIGQFIANAGLNANDDGNIPALTAAFLAALGTLTPVSPVKAWVNFGWNGTAIVIHAALNVSAVIRVSAGVYTVVFAGSLPDAFYTMTGSNVGGGGAAPPGPFIWSTTGGATNFNKTASSCTIAMISGSGPQDSTEVSAVFIR